MLVVIWFVLLIIGAYLLGSVPAAYLAAKLSHGIDIRQYGSGNVGVGNLWRMTSKWLALPVIIIDLGKGMIAVWAVQLMGLGTAQQVTVGLAAIIGHNWPVFLRFSGGRGILTTIGVVAILPLINGLIPWEIVVFGVLAVISAFIIHNVPVGVGAGVAALPLVSWGLDRPISIILGFLAIFMVVVIRRLTAPGPLGVVSIEKKQVLFNRLLFDRDIKDRESWIDRAPPRDSRKGRGEGQS